MLATLSFETPDTKRFPCIRLAYEALAADAAAPIALNAANEVAVDAFLDGRARFCDIPRVCEAGLARRMRCAIATLDDALAVDADAREVAQSVLGIRDQHPGAGVERASASSRRPPDP
jgi:1-deoxy-D-xylulose-5-phosphate reductoisomerase